MRINRIGLSILLPLLLATVAARAADQEDKRFQGLDGTFYLGAARSFDQDDRSGVYLGLAAGLRYQFDNDPVVGVAFEVGGIDALDGLWSVTALVGTAFGKSRRHLVYGNAGFARASLFCIFCGDEKRNANGARLGAGYEYAVSRHFRIRAQTFYSVLDGFRDPFVAAVGVGFQF